MLSVDQIALIRESYAAIGRAEVSYSELFYHRLLHRHPFTRILFPNDMARQVRVFRQTVDELVAHVDVLGSIEPTLVALAKRHVRYGVEPRHYAFVGDVLIDTFAEILGADFSADHRVAWNKLYEGTAGVMIAAADRDFGKE